MNKYSENLFILVSSNSVHKKLWDVNPSLRYSPYRYNIRLFFSPIVAILIYENIMAMINLDIISLCFCTHLSLVQCYRTSYYSITSTLSNRFLLETQLWHDTMSHSRYVWAVILYYIFIQCLKNSLMWLYFWTNMIISSILKKCS